MTQLIFTLLVCSINGNDCINKAAEYWIAGVKNDIDPVLLVSISVYECDFRDEVETKIYDDDGKKIIAKDLCPMGLRVTSKLNKKMAGRTREEIIDSATDILSLFMKNTEDHKEKYPALDHYNSGWKHVKNYYGVQVMSIYRTFYNIPLDKNDKLHLNSRTKDIIRKIKKDESHFNGIPIIYKPRYYSSSAS